MADLLFFSFFSGYSTSFCMYRHLTISKANEMTDLGPCRLNVCCHLSRRKFEISSRMTSVQMSYTWGLYQPILNGSDFQQPSESKVLNSLYRIANREFKT